jgi:hypothetical protein
VKVLESGRVVWRAGHAVEAAAHVVPAGEDAGRARFKVGSGLYQFEVRR